MVIKPYFKGKTKNHKSKRYSTNGCNRYGSEILLSGADPEFHMGGGDISGSDPNSELVLFLSGE